MAGHHRRYRLSEIARLLPTERETKVMSHGRSISVLPNDMVAGIMFPDLRVAPLSSLSAQRIIARGIDDVIVGEIFHSAMRDPVCAAGDHISGANRESLFAQFTRSEVASFINVA